MKFGRNLPRNQVPEWSTSYIQYKALKKIIKSAGEMTKRGDGVDTAGQFNLHAILSGYVLTVFRVLLLARSQP